MTLSRLIKKLQKLRQIIRKKTYFQIKSLILLKKKNLFLFVRRLQSLRVKSYKTMIESGRKKYCFTLRNAFFYPHPNVYNNNVMYNTKTQF